MIPSWPSTMLSTPFMSSRIHRQLKPDTTMGMVHGKNSSARHSSRYLIPSFRMRASIRPARNLRPTPTTMTISVFRIT